MGKKSDFLGHQINLAMIYDPWRLCTSLFIYVSMIIVSIMIWCFKWPVPPVCDVRLGSWFLKQIRPHILETIIWYVQGYPTLQVACYITTYHCQYYHILSNLILFHITSYSYPIFSIYIYIYIHTGWWFGTFFIFPIYIWGIIIPTDTNSIIFQRGRSTTNQPFYHHSIQLNP